MYRSAVAARTKRDSLLQEGLRRLRHTCEDASAEEVRHVMGEYMNMLRISGYDIKFRVQMLSGIMNRQRQIREEISRGLRLKFRSRQQIREQKLQKLGKFSNTWFLRDNTLNTLKIQATPSNTLSRNVHKALQMKGELADGGKTKVIEMGGQLITSGLSKTENFGGQGSCHLGRPCNTEEDTDCRISRSVYLSECQVCKTSHEQRQSVYVGTTGCCTHRRQRQHMQQIASKSTSNALSKHHWEEHQNMDPEFSTSILKGGFRFNLDRQICESIYIEQMNQDPEINLLNQRSEWGNHGIPRLQIRR